MAYENKNFGENRAESVYSNRVKAGKRRTYFFDVRTTRANDYFITITESKKRYDSDGYERHKTFIYKEDFNKFLAGLTDAINHVKTELMPNFDFDSFNHDYDNEGEGYSNSDNNNTNSLSSTVAEHSIATVPVVAAIEEDLQDVSVDNWKM